MASNRTLRVVSTLLLLAASAAGGWTASAWYAGQPSRVARRFSEMYWERHIPHNLTFWLGIQTQQAPTDLWTIQQILYDVKPEFVIETGTLNGGSALFHAMVLREINPHARILTIDIEPHVDQASHHAVFSEMVEVSTASSTSPETLAAVSKRVRGHRTLVLLDSNHTKEHVSRELHLYGPLVSVGSYMIVHDTNLYGEGKPVVEGPLAAVRDFVTGNPQFQIDRHREMMMLTLSSSGYLKKVRE